MSDRGQTLHDFAIGMTIFLLVLGYVFAFVPSLFAPFAPATDSSAVRADRTADTLALDVLAAREPGPGEANQSVAGTLDPACTDDFFDDGAVSQPPCPVSASSVAELVGVPDRTGINVTLERNGTVRRTVGPAPSVAVDRVLRAVRIVSLDGRDHRLVVRLW